MSSHEKDVTLLLEVIRCRFNLQDIDLLAKVLSQPRGRDDLLFELEGITAAAERPSHPAT